MNISGLLYSRIGYDLGDPMRVLIRSTIKDYIPHGSRFEVIDCKTGKPVIEDEIKQWGEKWKSFWWEANFSRLDRAGIYKILVYDKAEVSSRNIISSSDSFKVGENVLWNETVKTVAVEQMEARAKLARNGNGWKDCGADWREVNSHATMIIGLCDLLNMHYEKLLVDEVTRIAGQIIHGCDYIALCQDKAEQVGYPEGAIIHEIPNHMIIIPGDIAQSVVALAKASRLLTEINGEKSSEYLGRAVKAYEYLLHKAEPFGPEGFSHMNHGVPDDFRIPKEWMTRDLLMMLWGGIELWASGKMAYKEEALRIARQVMSRQIPEDKKEGEFFGHFRTFDSCCFSEKANTHHHVGHDTGATFPHYLIPFFEMLRRWYDHPDVIHWRKCLNDFAYGYFLPACSQNPFYLLPEGYFAGQGLLVFCGPWHGINTSIAFGAALAAKFEAFTGDKRFRNIAVGNLQWIAGLNAGLTQESFKGCLKWEDEIPDGVAIPYSQIFGIGSRYVGCWSGIKGSIVNGFAVNPQFQLIVEPTAENDGPWLFTDEDWIPHTGGWLSALSYLRNLKFCNF